MNTPSNISADEWTAICTSTTIEMLTAVKKAATPISVSNGDHGYLWGTGNYIDAADEPFLLTNEHVIEKRRTHPLTHKYRDSDLTYRLMGNHAAEPYPIDVGLSRFNTPWPDPNTVAVPMARFDTLMPTDPSELLFTFGYAGVNSRFAFNTLVTNGTGYLCQATALPDDDTFVPEKHFALDYRPDPATRVVGPHDLPNPNGMSGSLVWNTHRIEKLRADQAWSAADATVTGILWAFPSKYGCLIATSAPFLRQAINDCISRLPP